MKKLLIFTGLIFMLFLSVNAQVGIGGLPSGRSVLDLTNSNDKYLILPLTTGDPFTVLQDNASVIYYKGNLYMKTPDGIKVFTPWKWDGDSTGNISSPSTARIGIGIVPAAGTPCRLQVANSPLDVNEIGSNSSVIIGTTSSNHLLFDNNEIMAKKNATTADTLRFQEEAGAVAIRSAANSGGTNTVLKAYGSIEATGNVKAVNINATGKIQENGNELLPQGSIIMWSGSTIPAGWTLCDGVAHGSLIVPDLRSRFIVGADPSETFPDGDYIYSLNESGGKDTVVLNILQMPNHNHNYHDPGHTHTITTSNSSNNSSVQDDAGSNSSYTQNTGSSGTNITFNAQGGGLFHENRPPYYALAFIMKL